MSGLTREGSPTADDATAPQLPFAAAFRARGPSLHGSARIQRFSAELSILIGAWQSSPIWAAAAAFGVLVAAALLCGVQLAFFGFRPESAAAAAARLTRSADHRARELGALLLLGATVLIGLKRMCCSTGFSPACSRRFSKRC